MANIGVSSIAAAILTPILVSFLFAQAKKSQQHEIDGWIALRPTVGLYLLGTLGLAMAIFFLIVLASVVVQIFSEVDGEAVVLLIASPPMFVMSAFGVYQIFLIKIRFNESGLEYKSPRRKIFVRWSEMIKLTDNSLTGPYIRIHGRRLWVSKFLQGFRQLIDALKSNGIPADISVQQPH